MLSLRATRSRWMSAALLVLSSVFLVGCEDDDTEVFEFTRNLGPGRMAIYDITASELVSFTVTLDQAPSSFSLQGGFGCFPSGSPPQSCDLSVSGSRDSQAIVYNHGSEQGSYRLVVEAAERGLMSVRFSHSMVYGLMPGSVTPALTEADEDLEPVEALPDRRTIRRSLRSGPLGP